LLNQILTVCVAILSVCIFFPFIVLICHCSSSLFFFSMPSFTWFVPPSSNLQWWYSLAHINPVMILFVITYSRLRVLSGLRKKIVGEWGASFFAHNSWNNQAISGPTLNAIWIYRTWTSDIRADIWPRRPNRRVARWQNWWRGFKLSSGPFRRSAILPSLRGGRNLLLTLRSALRVCWPLLSTFR